MFEGIGAITIIVVIGILAIVVNLRKLLYICGPNEALVVSGSKRTVEGKQRGYRIVHGGRTIRNPLTEVVDKLDLTNMIIELQVKDAYAKGGIPLHVLGVANIKIASGEPLIGNAIERFLGKSRNQIMKIAQETLEGNLRGVLATLTPEEVNQNRVLFQKNLVHEADRDMRSLGLDLDNLKIQNVSDDVAYLDSIGRKQSAELEMKSRVAEAENKALATVRDAQNTQEKSIARINAEIEVAKAEAKRRIIDAQTKKEAMIAEEKSTVTAQVARARGELEVQRARIEQVKLQLLADKVRPAEAQKIVMEAAAKAAAAKIIEEGRAAAFSLREISGTWKKAGSSAREVFLTQKLEALIKIMTGTIGQTRIDRVTFIDSAMTGKNGGGNTAASAVAMNEQLKQTLGLDVPALLNSLAGNSQAGNAKVSTSQS